MAENAVENKVEFGLKNVHYAIVTDTGTSLQYGDVKAIPGATEISVEAEGDSNDFYADDTKYYTAVSNQGYSGKLTIARATDEFMQDVFGEVKDTVSGLQVDNTDVQPKAIALMFEFDGDRKKTRHVLFNVTATRPSIGSSTKSGKIESNKSELAFTASPDPYAARSKAKANQGDNSYDSFYNEVPVPGTAPKAPSTATTPTA